MSDSYHPLDVEPLTRREQSILALLNEGSTNQEIAGELNLSLATVKNDVREIMSKLYVTNRRDAVRAARQLGILPPFLLEQATQPPAPVVLPHGWETLTRRELEVALAQSEPAVATLTEQALAARLGVKKTTLKKHLQRIYKKLGVGNRASLAVVATRIAVLRTSGASPSSASRAAA